MAILRTLGKFFGGLIFTIFLVAAITVFSLAQLIEHDSLKTIATDLLVQQLNYQQVQQITGILKEGCVQTDSIKLTLGQDSFNINCKEVEGTSDENLTAVIAGQAFDQIYFKKYDCSFIECLQKPGEEKFLVLLSANAYKFLGNMQLALWVGVVLGAVIMSVSTETWGGRLKGFGTSLIFVGLPVVLMGQFQNIIFSLLPSGPVNLAPLIEKIFSSMLANYLIVLVFGIALTAAGYGIAIFKKKGRSKI